MFSPHLVQPAKLPHCPPAAEDLHTLHTKLHFKDNYRFRSGTLRVMVRNRVRVRDNHRPSEQIADLILTPCIL